MQSHQFISHPHQFGLTSPWHIPQNTTSHVFAWFARPYTIMYGQQNIARKCASRYVALLRFTTHGKVHDNTLRLVTSREPRWQNSWQHQCAHHQQRTLQKKMSFKQAIEIGSKPTSDPNQNLNMYKSLKRLQIYLPASNQIPALMHNKHVLENETLRQVQCQWLFVVEMLVWIKKCRQYKSPLHNDNHAKSVEPLDQQSAPPKVKASATPQNLLQHIASLFMMNSMICNIMFQWLAGLNPCHPKPCLVSMFAQQ